MKLLVAMFLCGFAAALSAQIAGPSPAPSQTFTSPDGIFQFHYPGLLVRCTRHTQADGVSEDWFPQDSCTAYSPVCDDSSSPDIHTLACLAYPKARFPDYPAFNAAAFSVAQVQQALTEKECLAGSKNWGLDPHNTGKTITIHHVQFQMFENSDAGMSHYLDEHAYRTFHRNTCYQLSIREASTNPGVFDPPIKEFTQQDQDEVHNQLQQALDSFRFLQ
ncbi:MAG TPA: hypothetical protein VHX63_07875 [Acidobacteriaceae bacterium]|jgi:hypothetical protein|nr:hypothetical protein [Acidobacteriaceae bacterium]